MGKLALIALIFVALIVWLRYKATPRPRDTNVTDVGTESGESMVMCYKCGVYLPGKEAVVGASGKSYCDAAHRALSHDIPA